MLKFSLKNIKNKTLFKVVALILCFAMVVPNLYIQDVNAATIAEINKDIDRIEAQQEAHQKEIDRIQAEIDKLAAEENKAQEHADAVMEKIKIIEGRIDETNANILELNENIKLIEEDLENQRLYYNDTMEQLKTRIKALYKMGDVGTIEILMNSTSLYDFSLKAEAIERMTQQDKELMGKIQKYIDDTKEERDALEEQKKMVAVLKVSLEIDQEDLGEEYLEYASIIASLQNQQANKQELIEEIEHEDAKLDKEIQNLIAEKKRIEEEERKRKEEEERKKREEEEKKKQEQMQQGGHSGSGSTVNKPPSNGSGGSLNGTWPVPGYGLGYITQYFGGSHKGLDIGAPYGTPIVATADGEVLSAGWHWSWGNNVLIYHNGTYSTRYAHMCSMAVYSGQYVKKGQIIGYVGNTGYSFGNHLHFEVYQNGTRVNPYPYVT
ncbi:MAG: hypothetical protein E7564_09405 [Ruminococcaceae bacterium]|nr:hypothetical protein [Oscillospiraceae bacterium]